MSKLGPSCLGIREAWVFLTDPYKFQVIKQLCQSYWRKYPTKFHDNGEKLMGDGNHQLVLKSKLFWITAIFLTHIKFSVLIFGSLNLSLLIIQTYSVKCVYFSIYSANIVWNFQLHDDVIIENNSTKSYWKWKLTCFEFSGVKAV